jgi:predicted kinase
MIKNFVEFITEEISKNEPIKELRDNKVCIILMGTPAVGKSYFVANYIKPKRNLKVFSTDDISLLYTKDPNRYHAGSADVNIARLLNFIKTGQSFIYDTTGTHPESIFSVVKKSKENGYKIIFIHLVGPYHQSLKQNIQRDRKVDPDYIQFSYQTQHRNMQTYKEMNPDAYYVVYNKEGKYVFFKFVNGKLLKKKVDRYVESYEDDEDEYKYDDSDFEFDVDRVSKNLQELGHQMGRLKSALKHHIRSTTPKELFEDHFLEFDELEGFTVNYYNQNNMLIHFVLNNMLDKDSIESELDRYTKKLKMVKARIEDEFATDCHFAIYLNGKLQAELNPKTHKTDDYKFTGIGDRKWGNDKKHTYSNGIPVSGNLPFPDDKVAMKIDFYII